MYKLYNLRVFIPTAKSQYFSWETAAKFPVQIIKMVSQTYISQFYMKTP